MLGEGSCKALPLPEDLYKEGWLLGKKAHKACPTPGIYRHLMVARGKGHFLQWCSHLEAICAPENNPSYMLHVSNNKENQSITKAKIKEKSRREVWLER